MRFGGMNVKKQGFLLSSAILLVTVTITKVFGLVFKIPLASMLGGTGMAYFSCAYSIFMPIYAISVTGLPSAVSKMVSENVAFGRYQNIQKIRRVAMVSFSIIGVLFSVLLMALAKPLTSSVIHSEGSYISVLIISPCIYFGAVISVYRGYFEGMRNMMPTAASEIIEATVKMSAGLLLSFKAMKHFSSEFETYGTVLGKICHSAEDAAAAALPLIAAAAILGVTLSAAACALYLFIIYRIKGDGITKMMLSENKTVQGSKEIFKKMIILIIPIAIGSVITNLTSLIDLGSIIRYIKKSIDENPSYIVQSYYSVICNGVRLAELPNFIYGSYTGMAITIFNIVPAFTAMFGKSALPNVSECWAKKDFISIDKSIHSVLCASMYIGVPAGLGISFLSKPILMFLYSSRPDEVLVSCKPLTWLGIGIIFLSISIPVFALLQAIGKPEIPLKILIGGVIIKLVGNFILIPIPQLNISGAAISTNFCYLYIAIFSLIALLKQTKTKLSIMLVIFYPLIGGLICAISARYSYNFINFHLNSRLSLVISIVIGVIFYIFTLLLLVVPTKCSEIRGFHKKNS